MPFQVYCVCLFTSRILSGPINFPDQNNRSDAAKIIVMSWTMAITLNNTWLISNWFVCSRNKSARIFLCHYLFSKSLLASMRVEWESTLSRSTIRMGKRNSAARGGLLCGKWTFLDREISYLSMFDQMAHLFLCLKIYICTCVHTLEQQ